MRSRLAGALGLSVATSAAILLLNVLTGVLLARSLGPHDRGVLAAVLLWPAVLAALGGLGLPEATTYRAARARTGAGTIAGTAMALALLQGTAVAAIGLVVLRLALARYGDGALRAGTVYLLYAPVSTLALAAMAVLNGLRHFRAYQALRLSIFVLIAGPVVALAASGALTIGHVVAVYLVGNVVVAAVAVLLARRACGERLHVDRATARGLLAFGIRSHAGSVSSLLNERLDQLLVSVFLAPAQLGLYVVAVTITSATSLLGSAVSPIAAAEVAHLGEARAGPTIRRLVCVTLWPSVAVSLAMIVLARPLLGLFFGAAYASVTTVARLLLVAAVFLSTNRALTAILNGLGRPFDAAAAEILAVCCTVVLLAALLPTIGLIGAGIASLVAYACSTLLMAFRVASAIRIPARRLVVTGEAPGAVT